MSNVIKVYEFLRDFNKIKNRVITNIEEYTDLIYLNSLIESEFVTKEDINESDTILTVKQVELLDLPKLPDGLEPWLKNGFKDINIENAEVNEILSKPHVSGDLVEDFYNSEERVNDFLDWNTKRKEWLKINRLRDNARKLFRKLYTLKSEIDTEAETYELVYSDFVLEFDNKLGNRIKHPIFTKKIDIQFLASKDLLEVRFKEGNIELYSSFLRQIELNPAVIRQIIEKVEESNLDFSSKFELNEIISTIKQFLTNALDISLILVYEEPVIYKRKKNQGYAKFIDSIIEDIEIKGEQDIPKYMIDLLYHSNESISKSNDVITSSFDGLDKEVLLNSTS
jgi:hypothetical protein